MSLSRVNGSWPRPMWPIQKWWPIWPMTHDPLTHFHLWYEDSSPWPAVLFLDKSSRIKVSKPHRAHVRNASWMFNDPQNLPMPVKCRVSQTVYLKGETSRPHSHMAKALRLLKGRRADPGKLFDYCLQKVDHPNIANITLEVNCSLHVF